MNKPLIPFAFLVVTFLFPLFSYAYPEGQLYWVVEEYPTEFSLYTTSDTYNGAVAAIDYACQQSAGIGTYSGEIQMLTSSINFPAQKAGYCRNTRPFFPGLFYGTLYNAYLYCNGEKRDLMDDSQCATPEPPFDISKNIGPDCPI